MKTIHHQKFKWQSIEEMHTYSTLWNSKIKFVLDECVCLYTMLKNKIFVLNESHLTQKAQGLSVKLELLQKEAAELLKKIKKHRNKLKVMFSKEESFDSTWAYKHEHRKLLIKLNELVGQFKRTKIQILRVVCEAMKYHKQKKIAS